MVMPSSFFHGLLSSFLPLLSVSLLAGLGLDFLGVKENIFLVYQEKYSLCTKKNIHCLPIKVFLVYQKICIVVL